MIDRMHIGQLKSWCDEVGGEWKDEVAEGLGYHSETKETNRCVLNNEVPPGGAWDAQSGRFNFRDTEFVEIDGSGIFRAETNTGETLEITREEWEQHETEGQQNYESEEVNGAVIDSLESVSQWDGLTASRHGVKVDDETAWVEKVHVNSKKRPDEVQSQIVTREDRLDEWRVDQFTEWESEVERAVEEGEDLPALHVQGYGDPENWLKNTEVNGELLWDRYQELQEEHEDSVSPHEPLDCPDNADFVEVEDGIQVEGEVDSIACTRNEAVVQFRGDDGEDYVIEGSTDGSEPIQVRYANSSRTLEELDPDDIEFLGVRNSMNV